MSSLLKSTQNTRAILPDSFRFVRSDVPHCITELEVQWLIDNNIVTIIGLREESERERKKCPLINNSFFQYYCMPVTGGNSIPESDTNVLYFCNAGKDRTGVVSAILLHKLGMAQEYIINDYMKSKENLKNMLDAYAKECPKVDINVITPHERYMKEFLEWYCG